MPGKGVANLQETNARSKPMSKVTRCNNEERWASTWGRLVVCNVEEK
jgi:hypothetical protein